MNWFWSAKWVWNASAVASVNRAMTAANQAGAIAGHQRDAATDFDEHCESEADGRKRQARAGDHRDRRGRGSYLGDAREQEQRTEEDTARQRHGGLQSRRAVHIGGSGGRQNRGLGHVLFLPEAADRDRAPPQKESGTSSIVEKAD
jgi:hypothetical protein